MLRSKARVFLSSIFFSATLLAQEHLPLMPMDATVIAPYIHSYLEPRFESAVLETYFKGETIKLTPQAVQKIKNAILSGTTSDLVPFVAAITRIGSIAYVEWNKLEIHFDDRTELEQLAK